MECRKCKAIIPDDGMFCPVCGARADGNKPCKHCGKLIPEEAVFCVYCGQRIDGKTICPKCSAELPENAVFCSHCRTRLDNKVVCSHCGKLFEGEFCPYCGEAYVSQQQTQVASTVAVQPQVAEAPVVTAPVQQVQPVVNETQQVQPQVIPVVAPVVVPTSEQPANTQTVKTTQTTKSNVSESDTQNTNVEAIQCPQCGSTIVDVLSEDMAICKHCSTQIKLNVQKTPQQVTNIVNVQMSGDNGELPITFYAMPCEVESTQFLVETLTHIALNKDAPEDIFEVGEFSPVRKEDRQYLIGTGLADMTYSATVGYDYTVEYTKYDSNGKPYRATRTETKWEPFSGTHKGEYTNGVENGDDAETASPMLYISEGSISKAVEYEKADFETQAPLAPQEGAIEDVKHSIQLNAKYHCEASLPGHRHKQFVCNGTVELKKLECHVVPQYILDYKYKEQSETMYRHASTVATTKGKIVSAKAETLNEVEENVKTLNFITCGALILSILASLLIPVPFLIIIFGAIALASFIYLEVVRGITKKKIYKRKSEARRKGLIKFLSDRGLELPDGINLEQTK